MKWLLGDIRELLLLLLGILLVLLIEKASLLFGEMCLGVNCYDLFNLPWNDSIMKQKKWQNFNDGCNWVGST